MTQADAAMKKLAREVNILMAYENAHAIASVAAEELIRTEGQATSCPDEYAIPQCQADDHMRRCIKHLVWAGLAHSEKTADGYIVVRLQDLTLESLA